MSRENNKFYVVINGMDLTGKTTLANKIKENCKDESVQILRSAFKKDNPLDKLASRLRREREAGEISQEALKELYEYASREDAELFELLKKQSPVITDEAIGHLYANATAEDLESFNPTTAVIHDSSTIIKTSTIHRDLGSGSGLIKKLEILRLKHPRPTKPEHSILLEASIDAKIDRLHKRIKEGAFVSEQDRKVFEDPKKVQRRSEIMKEITLDTFPGTLILDTTKMSEQELVDEVKNRLEIFKAKE